MNILLIPEDFRHDQYILAPLFNGLLNLCGKPNANVRVCLDPLLGGVSEAMKADRLEEIFERYDGMIDICVLCVDRDAELGREAALRAIEQRYCTDNRKLICVAAIEELETWLLAGHDLPGDWRWQEVRAERDVKERFFVPFARMKRVEFSPGQGRKILGAQLRGQVNRVLQRCGDEMQPLLAKLQAAV